MTKALAIPDRLRLWEYAVSHSVAVFRRPASAENPENLDLVFVAVDYFDVPRSLDGLELRDASPEELQAFQGRTGPLQPWAKLFVLVSAGRTHFMVAGNWLLERNRRDLFDSGCRDGARHSTSTVLAGSGTEQP